MVLESDSNGKAINKKPNIVIFNPDQFRADALGHLGNSAMVTPNLDSICKDDAVSFKNAFCQNPVCTPSRCSFMSGWYPHVAGHRTMNFLMSEDEPVLLKKLKESGYYVWWGGKNDLVKGQDSWKAYCDFKHETNSETMPSLAQRDTWRGSDDGDNYYSFYAGEIDLNGDEIYNDFDWTHVNGALDFIENANENQPFCLYLPLIYPHPPYGVEMPWYSAAERSKVSCIPPVSDFDKKPEILKLLRERQNLSSWSEERFVELKAVYLGMCARIDYQFGLLIDMLKKKKMYDDTLILFFSDHGDFTGDYGLVEKTQNTFEDCLVNVPFIIKPPKRIEVKPGINDALIELLDIPATVFEVLGMDFDYTQFGKSVLDIVTGKKEEHRDAVFCEGGRLEDELHCSEITSDTTDEKSLYWPRLSIQQQEITSNTKAVMCRTKQYKYVKRLYESDELYDLTEDPCEISNLIDSEHYQQVRNSMAERLLRFYMETCDVVPWQHDKREFV